MMSVEFVVEIILAVQIEQEHLMVQLTQMNVGLVMMIAQMTVYKIVQEHGVEV